MASSTVERFKSFSEWKVSIKSPSSNYAAKQRARKVLFALDIPYPLLKAWHSFVMEKPARNGNPTAANEGPSTSVNQEESPPTYTYTDLLQFSIPGRCCAISKDPVIRNEIHSSLRRIAGAVSSEFKKTKGRKNQALKSKSKRFHIFEGQILSVAELKRKRDLLKGEIEEQKAKYNKLDLEVKTLAKILHW